MKRDGMRRIDYTIDVNPKKDKLTVVRKLINEQGFEEDGGEMDFAPIHDLLDKLPLSYIRGYLDDRDNRHVDDAKNSDEAQILLGLKENTQMQPWLELSDSSIERYIGRTCYYISQGNAIRKGTIAEVKISFSAFRDENGKRNFHLRHEVFMSFVVELRFSDGSFDNVLVDKVFFNGLDAIKALNEEGNDTK